MLTPGRRFPRFELSDQEGKVWTLDSLLGSPSVVYFYPKDDTSGCTQEACEFRDLTPKFSGVKLLGVSPDSVASHQKFAKKHGLPFPLLADEGHALCEACGVWVEKSMYGRTYMGVERTTFLLDAEGMVANVWRKVKPAGHAADVLAATS